MTRSNIERSVWNCERRRSEGAKGVARFVNASAAGVSDGVGGGGLNVDGLGESGGKSGKGVDGRRLGAVDTRFKVEA